MESATYTLIGINYKKADTQSRSLYTLNSEQYQRILENARFFPVKDILIIATCNRTEIYGFCNDSNVLANLLNTELKGNLEDFLKIAYIKKGKGAMRHLFNVTAGLDAQILGDYEIVGQVKEAMQTSKIYGKISAFSERLFNSALQASKEIRTQTKISSGIVSVSFAAAQYIKKKYPQTYSDKEILLIGLGDIGTTTLKHLRSYLHHQKITLINRTLEKIHTIAPALPFYTWEQLPEAVRKADIIIVATRASQPFITTQHCTKNKEQLFIDLSVPKNVDSAVNTLANIQVADVDELSQMVDNTLEKRRAELPKANTIIDKILQEFILWTTERKQMSFLKDMKQHLLTLQKFNTPVSNTSNDTDVQKYLNDLALQFRKQSLVGCSVIQTYQNFLYAEKRK